MDDNGIIYPYKLHECGTPNAINLPNLGMVNKAPWYKFIVIWGMVYEMGYHISMVNARITIVRVEW